MHQQMSLELPDVRKPVYDEDATIAALEDVFERYRYFRFTEFEEREATITASYSDMPRGSQTSDQTASVAIHNVDERERRRLFVERVERAVQRLPYDQRRLIELKYMQDELVSNFQVYTDEMMISERYFRKLRWKAFEKLAGLLRVGVLKEGGDP